ncbi:hypothetical protein AB0I16_33275 [Streptomyces sp. NPDC050703]|uniref:hypothetical protein n=1 Tax=Streptomyces sp. NPDC050703 TaxID=3157218 RepID=UPI003433E986
MKVSTKRALKDLGAVVATGVVAGLLVLAMLFVLAWALMLVIGMWHGHNSDVPALGLVDCAFAVTVMSFFGLLVAPRVSK